MRSLTKSPLKFAQTALAIGRHAFNDYSRPKSPQKFTQPQLFAMLALKEFLQQDYRGIVALLGPEKGTFYFFDTFLSSSHSPSPMPHTSRAVAANVCRRASTNQNALFSILLLLSQDIDKRV